MPPFRADALSMSVRAGVTPDMLPRLASAHGPITETQDEHGRKVTLPSGLGSLPTIPSLIAMVEAALRDPYVTRGEIELRVLDVLAKATASAREVLDADPANPISMIAVLASRRGWTRLQRRLAEFYAALQLARFNGGYCSASYVPYAHPSSAPGPSSSTPPPLADEPTPHAPPATPRADTASREPAPASAPLFHDDLSPELRHLASFIIGEFTSTLKVRDNDYSDRFEELGEGLDDLRGAISGLAPVQLAEDRRTAQSARGACDRGSAEHAAAPARCEVRTVQGAAHAG